MVLRIVQYPACTSNNLVNESEKSKKGTYCGQWLITKVLWRKAADKIDLQGGLEGDKDIGR